MTETAVDRKANRSGPARSRLAKLRILADQVRRGEDDRSAAQRRAAIAFAIRVASAGIVFLSQIALARWLGRHDYGVFAFVWTAVMLTGGLLPLGFSSSSQRFLPQHAERGEMGHVRGFVHGGRIFVVIVATGVSALGLLGLWFFEEAVSAPYVLPLYLAIFCLPAYALMDVQDGIARSYSWIDLALVLPYIFRPLVIIGVVGIALLIEGEADAVTASYALIASTWATGLLQMVLLDRRFGRQTPRVPQRHAWRLWILTSLPIFLVESIFMLLTNIDVLMLGIYTDPGAVGVYYAAARTMLLVSFVQFAVVAASAHKFAEYREAGDEDRLRAFVRDTVDWIFWPTLGLILVMLVLGKPALWMFGPEFTAGYPLMFVLAVGLAARATVGPADRVLNMLGQQNICALVYLFVLEVNLVLNYLLIPRYGLQGAAVATSTALVCEAVLLFIAARARLGINVSVFSPRVPRGA